jgi:hypothetical protein
MAEERISYLLIRKSIYPWTFLNECCIVCLLSLAVFAKDNALSLYYILNLSYERASISLQAILKQLLNRRGRRLDLDQNELLQFQPSSYLRMGYNFLPHSPKKR